MKFIRLSTLLSIAGAVSAGALLFWTSQNVQQSEDRLRYLQRSVKSEEQTIRVLHAEWDYLNRPDRLESLAVRHLGQGIGLSSSAAFSVSDDVSALPNIFIPVLPQRKPFIKAQPVVLRSAVPLAPPLRMIPPKKKTQSFRSLLEGLNAEEGSHD